ncbi:hypothetical protein ACH5RR_000239 [Cinchona calisaya]|uniref:Uncharacterized protein n=1 Tax=Cinchona calisaya TaxID=153742 RepID=A0ABD3B067_9GENT
MKKKMADGDGKYGKEKDKEEGRRLGAKKEEEDGKGIVMGMVWKGRECWVAGPGVVSWIADDGGRVADGHRRHLWSRAGAVTQLHI